MQERGPLSLSGGIGRLPFHGEHAFGGLFCRPTESLLLCCAAMTMISVVSVHISVTTVTMTACSDAVVWHSSEK